MKRKLLKAMACAMSVCMLSMSLTGCGDDSSGSSTPGSSTPGSTTPDSTPDSTPDDSNTGDDQQGGVDDIGADRSNGLYPAYDLGGITLTVLDHNDLGGKNPDAADLDEMTKHDRQDLKDYIEAKYNVNLVFVPLPTNDWDELNNQIVMEYTGGNPVADIMDVYYTHAGTYIKNNILYDFTSDLASHSEFNSHYFFNWVGKSWGISSGIGGEGLYYNKDMIKQLGMEETPAEMFDKGMWSYDDCYNYLKELKALMGADEYPMFVDPYYWMLFATAANGEVIVASTGELNYVSDPFLEVLDFFSKCLDEQLIGRAPASINEETGKTQYDTWNHPGATFDAGNTYAIAHRASWQAAGINSGDAGFKFELGFVPYPWGSNVTIGHTGDSGDYLTLSDNYVASHFDGQILCMVDTVKEKANPVEVLSMLVEWMGWDSKMTAYVPDGVQKGGDWLEDGIDKDLYFWSLSKERLEPYAFVRNSGIGLTMAPNGTMYGDSSVRSAMESFYNQDMNIMIEAGYATEDAFHEIKTDDEEGGEEDEG